MQFGRLEGDLDVLHPMVGGIGLEVTSVDPVVEPPTELGHLDAHLRQRPAEHLIVREPLLPVGLLEAFVERPDLVLGDPPRPLPPHAGHTKDLGLPEAGGEQDREAGDDLPVIGADQLVRARSRQPEPDVDPVE